MRRSTIYKKLAEIVRSDTYTLTQKSKAKELTTKVMLGKIDEARAEEMMIQILSLNKNPMLEEIRKKTLGKTLLRYHRRELLVDNDTLDILKMISSIITHTIIQAQQMEDSSILSSVEELSNILHRCLVDGHKLDESELDEALYKYGLGREVMMIEQ